MNKVEKILIIFVPVAAGNHYICFEKLFLKEDTSQSVGLSSEQVISPTHRTIPDNTQQSHETDIHAPGGIRTYNPSKRAAADQRLAPRGHWDQPYVLTH